MRDSSFPVLWLQLVPLAAVLALLYLAFTYMSEITSALGAINAW